MLAGLFPELANAAGQIESRLMPAQALQQQLGGASASGSWYLKRDDELPVAGSIKARGGFHEVLALAESIALEHGLLPHADADRRLLATPQARALFGQYAVTVGSTGNLGMSIGVMAAALGFDAVVHMSADAKEWKKDRLRQRGVRVIEHAGDYAQAVAAGRAQALPRRAATSSTTSNPSCCSSATPPPRTAWRGSWPRRAARSTPNIRCSSTSPAASAARRAASPMDSRRCTATTYCFFAEPVASPCMLVQLAAGMQTPTSVYDLGLTTAPKPTAWRSGRRPSWWRR